MEQEATGHDQKRATNNVCGSVASEARTRRTGESRARREGNRGCLSKVTQRERVRLGELAEEVGDEFRASGKQ